MRKAIYPGTFDPITKGHLDIIERAAKLFDEVIVVIMQNPVKKSLFEKEERLVMMKEVCAHIDNVVCDIGKGMSVVYAHEQKAQVMIRGIRAVVDYEYELQNATANMWIDGNIETCFLLSKPQFSFLSSSNIKEMASYGQDVSAFVDACVSAKLKEKYKK
ncbi:MAG: pantetheine-phosphate adenylyltransferase [Breznakia sp.]